MLKKVLTAVVILIAVLVTVVATRPGTYAVKRSTEVRAAPAAVYAHLNDFRRWDAWSPWDKLDPAMRRSFKGPDAGIGAVYEWSGNDKVGEGRMTIVNARPPDSLTIQLEFLKPWAQTSTTTFSLAPTRTGTEVTWTMAGTNGFVSKAFSLFVNMDEMVGPDFERGLAALKVRAEGDATRAAELTAQGAAP